MFKILTASLLLLAPMTAQAAVGVGLGLTSSGSGLTLKGYDNGNAFQALVGVRHSNILIQADYLFQHKLDRLVNFYAGPGVGIREDEYVALRVPVGVSFNLTGAPLEIAGEIAPSVAFWDNDDTDGFIDIGLYLRFQLR